MSTRSESWISTPIEQSLWTSGGIWIRMPGQRKTSGRLVRPPTGISTLLSFQCKRQNTSNFTLSLEMRNKLTTPISFGIRKNSSHKVCSFSLLVSNKVSPLFATTRDLGGRVRENGQVGGATPRRDNIHD